MWKARNVVGSHKEAWRVEFVNRQWIANFVVGDTDRIREREQPNLINTTNEIINGLPIQRSVQKHQTSPSHL